VRAALLALALLSTSAHAVDIKLWPLFRYSHDEATGDLHWSALGPLIEFSRTAERRDLRIRPLLWLRQNRGPGHDDAADILFPLAATRWRDDYQSFRLLLFTFRSSAPRAPAPGEPPAGAETWTSRFTLFPLVFYRSSPELGTHLSVLPFWLDQPDFFGYQHVRVVMFPAYVRLDQPNLERRFYGFPFVQTLGGANGRGFHVWPLYGDKSVLGESHTSFVAWPFHLRSERLVPGWGWERQRIDLPVYASVDGAGRESHAWGLFAYTHTIDHRQGYEAIGSPWPLVVRDRVLGEDAYRTWRFAPFYGRSDRDGISSRFYAWPAWRTRVQDAPDFHYERRDAMLLLWRRQEQWSAATGRHESLLTVFPALRSESENDRSFGQSPAIVDSLLPKNRGVLALWAPMWGLVRWDTEPDGAHDWNVGWGLLANERRHLVGPWHLSLAPGGGSTDGD